MPASEQERLQIELILATYDNVAVFPDDWATGDFEAEYLYRTDKLVVRAEDADTALENSRGRGVAINRDDIELAGAARLDVTGFGGDGPSLRQELSLLQGELGEDRLGPPRRRQNPGRDYRPCAGRIDRRGVRRATENGRIL